MLKLHKFTQRCLMMYNLGTSCRLKESKGVLSNLMFSFATVRRSINNISPGEDHIRNNY